MFQAGSGRSTEQIQRAVERVFARPEFAEDERTLMDDLWDWLRETLNFDVDPAAASSAIDGGMRLLLLVVTVVVAWFVWRQMSEYLGLWRNQRTDALAARLAVRDRVRELYAGALRAREAGDLRLAVRLGLFALVTGLGVNGELEYRDAWTYREILARGRPERALSALLTELVAELEAKEFGEVPVAARDLDRLEGLCREHLASLLEESR